jgi:D-alanyl-D-alanine carboxypeptidase (penicillin-binding protein 5/6)
MRCFLLSVVTAACLAVAGPAAAAVPSHGGAVTGGRTALAGGVVGGDLLGSRGVVEQPLAGAPALPHNIGAVGSWLVADVDTGAVLAAKAPHARFLPASTLKTLTAVTLLPRLDPQQLVTATNADASVDGSKVGLVPGQRYSIATLFTALLVVSGNDAADALAQAAGGIPQTVSLMNAEARYLQADDTLARTPSGLDAPGETTSAYDLALIARAGLAMPAFRHYIGIVRGWMPAPHGKRFQIYTHNHLLTTYRGDIGVKNGYTVAAGATYVGAATRGGRTIVVTLMHAPPDFWPQARALLDWGFAADGHVTPVGTLVGPAQATPTVQQVSHDTLAAGPHHVASGSIASWKVLLLATSAGLAIVVTTQRQRRRRGRSRLRLPPL